MKHLLTIAFSVLIMGGPKLPIFEPGSPQFQERVSAMENQYIHDRGAFIFSHPGQTFNACTINPARYGFYLPAGFPAQYAAEFGLNDIVNCQ